MRDEWTPIATDFRGRIAAATVAALALSGCGSVAVDSADPRRAIALAPYARTVGPAGAIRVAEGAVLYPARVDGAAAWCSSAPLYFAPGEARGLCLFDPAGGAQAEGWFASAYVPGTYSGARLAVDIPYRVGQTAPLPPRR